MSEALDLYRLQKIDTSIDKATARLKEIEKTLSDDRRVKRAEKVYEGAKELATQIRIKLQLVENKIEDQRIKRKTDQASMFSGKIKNPKALQDLQMETEALKRYISQLEDEQFEIMIQYEEAEKAENQAEKDLKQAKGTAVEENAVLAGEKLKLEEDLKTLLREKEAVLQGISPQSLKLYNQLKKTKRGVAVTSVSEGSCSICGQALTPADQQSIRASNSLVFCPSCGRILFEG
jgi:predicted  nucleic acid-binding Zn-ribbon protein